MTQSLGKRITENRKRLGLTQDQLAEQLGVTAQAVSKWENDLSCPDINTLPKLAEIFGISVDALLGHTPPPPVHEAEILEDEQESAYSERDDAGWNMHFSHRRKLFPIGLAVYVLLTGILSLLSVILELDVTIWNLAWPLAFLVYGLFRVFTRFSFFSLGCSFFGGYFLLDNLHVLNLQWGAEIVFPVILLLLGVSLLADALKKRKYTASFTGRSCTSGNSRHSGGCQINKDSFHCATSFGGDRHNIILPKLSHGEAECSFGELTVNLSGVGALSESCTVSAECSFGELNLQIPKKFRVDPKTSSSFGSVTVKGEPNPEASAILRLEANVSFGEISVTYI